MVLTFLHFLQFSHLAWIQTDRKSGGLGDLKYPLVSDVTKSISKAYSVLIPDQVNLFSPSDRMIMHGVANQMACFECIFYGVTSIKELVHCLDLHYKFNSEKKSIVSLLLELHDADHHRSFLLADQPSVFSKLFASEC